MASLTPGVLSKLLENAGNNDAKVTGQHRSPLLQVIEIVPSLADDPWDSNGFFLKVSDSLHSAYVSIPNDDVDLIYTDKIQLGQFVYVAGLDEGSPVPVFRGLKPVPRRRPCVGTPTDLVPSDLLPMCASVEFSKEKRPKKANKAKLKGDAFNDSTKFKAKNGSLDMRRLSLDSSRRAWDSSPTLRNAAELSSTRLKSKQVLADGKAPFKKNPSQKRLSLNISPFKSKNDIFSPKSGSKPSKEDVRLISGEAVPCHTVKVPISFRTWSDHRISWNALPPTIHNPGKEAVSHRNVTFLAAARALEEPSAIEAIIRCLQAFAELCESSQKVSAGSLAERFLNIHKTMQRAAMAVNSLLSTRPPEAKSISQHPLVSMCKTLPYKKATSWVQAAVETDLSKFRLFRDLRKSENADGQTYDHYVVIENTSKDLNSENNPHQKKLSPKDHCTFLPGSGAKLVPCPSKKNISPANRMSVERDSWSTGTGIKEAASLAEKLLLVSREWFLRYLEDSLNKGFGLSRGEGSNKIAYLLVQLKRVNQWLDDSVVSGLDANQKIEHIRKKLRSFLLEHVDSDIAGK